jgi:hypothetical protein
MVKTSTTLDDFLIKSNWSELIGDGKKAEGFAYQSARVCPGGTKIRYGGGKFVRLEDDGKWRNYEIDGARIEEIKRDRESTEILTNYRQFLENARNCS